MWEARMTMRTTDDDEDETHIIRYGTVGTYLPAYIICPGGGGLPYL